MKKQTIDGIAVDPDREYNLREVVELGLMGKGKTYFVCKNIITDELWKPMSKRILKARKVGNDRGAYYFIKGANLIKYRISTK